jgi:hypothetical protein
MGDFSGIDPQALQGMITSFATDKDHLRGRASEFRTRFAALGLDTGPLAEIVGICGWLDDQLPGLKRRHTLAVAMDRTAGKDHLVHVPEPVLSASAAQSDGKALAERLNHNTGGDAKAGQAYHDMALELAAHKDDPDFCSAFYANLNPVVATTLPADLAATGSSTAAADLETYSHAFATAVSAQYPAPGFDKVKKTYLTKIPEPGNVEAEWNRAAMLSAGGFPTDFLAKATRVNGLDRFAKNPKGEYATMSTEAKSLGLPDDLVALDLQNLSHDGRAAFDAVAQMGDPDNPDLQGHLSSLMTYGRLNSEVQTALGAMMDTASGVHGSYDTKGTWHVDASYKPNPWEQNFAYCAILAAANTKDTLGFNGNFKSDMGRLAATYAPEFATAGNVMDGIDVDDSSFGAPSATTYHELPGLSPVFHLGGVDTYNFLKIFADSDAHSAPYDEAMGTLQHEVLVKAAQMDKAALLHNTPGTDGNFNRSAKAFGNVARLQYDAMAKVRGDMDKQEEAFRENFKAGLILPMELVGEPEMGYGPTMLWRAATWGGKEFGLTSGIEMTAGPEELEGVDERNLEMIEASRYNTASALVEGGWPTTKLPADLLGKDGRLKPFDELSDSTDPKEAEEQRKERLDQFDAWLADQDLPVGTTDFHSREEEGSGLLTTSQADVVAHKAESED